MEQTKLQQQIHTVKYDPLLHLATVNKWLIGWNMPFISSDSLPKHGLMLSYNSTFIAAMFLNMGECGTGIIDGFIRDPELYNVYTHLRSTEGHLYFNELTLQIINLAKSLGITKLMAFTTNNSTHMRALSLNFELQPHSMLIRKVG